MPPWFRVEKELNCNNNSAKNAKVCGISKLLLCRLLTSKIMAQSFLFPNCQNAGHKTQIQYNSVSKL